MNEAKAPISSAGDRTLHDVLDASATRRLWIVSRGIWMLMALLIIAALLGFAGSGPMSRASVGAHMSNGGTVEIEYPRFSRFHTEEQASIVIDAPDVTGDTLRLEIGTEFSDQISLEQVTPQPDAVSFGVHGSVYEWSVEDWSQPLTIALTYQPDDLWKIGAEFVVQAGDAPEQTLRFTQWVAP